MTNPTYMARAVAGGAAGYLLKGIELDDLLQALRAVTNGEMLLHPQDLIRALRRPQPRFLRGGGSDRAADPA